MQSLRCSIEPHPKRVPTWSNGGELHEELCFEKLYYEVKNIAHETVQLWLPLFVTAAIRVILSSSALDLRGIIITGRKVYSADNVLVLTLHLVLE